MTARVNVIIDAKATDQSMSVRYGISEDDKETVSIKFVLQNIRQINFIVSKLAELVQFKRPFEMEFGKCPSDVRDNVEFKTKLCDILRPINPQQFVVPSNPKVGLPFPPPGFVQSIQSVQPVQPVQPVQLVQERMDVSEFIDMSKVDTLRAKRSVATMKVHIKEYGAHPNFSDMASQKNRTKILNYMKSALAIPGLGLDEALYVASQL
jgi:hypothetical protein